MKRNPLAVNDLVLVFLALILIGISCYQTYLGLQQIFGSASFPISFVLSSLLLLLCWNLRSAKLRNSRVNGLMWIYVFVASMCFVANFNALYTRFMRTNIYYDKLRSLSEEFNKLEADVNAKFNYKYPPETAQQIESKKKQLIEQIQDKGNPGIGDRAKSLIRDLEHLLGDRVDILAPVGGNFEDLAMRMGRQIDGMVLNLSPKESVLKEDLTKVVLKYNKKIEDALVLTKNDLDIIAQRLIDEAVSEYNKIGNMAKGVLGDERFRFEPIQSNTQEIGKIGYAFSHAIQNFGIYQIIVLMGCLVLDFLIPIIILLFTRPNDKAGSHPVSVIRTRRSGGVITPTKY